MAAERTALCSSPCPRTGRNSLGRFWHISVGLSRFRLSEDRVRSAVMAGIDSSCVGTMVSTSAGHGFLSLLSLAILYGQGRIANACVDLGVEMAAFDSPKLIVWLKKYLHEKEGTVPELQILSLRLGCTDGQHWSTNRRRN